MIEAYKDYFKRYFDFSGKTSLGGFWWVVLANIIISTVLGFLGFFGATLASVYSLVTLIPGIAIAVRRLHDTNRSGFNLFWLLLPLIGWIILIVFLASNTKK